MEKSKVKIGGIYKLDWELIEQDDYFCKCGGSFRFLKRRNEESAVKGEVVQISHNKDAVNLRFFNKNDEYLDYFWVYAEKLLPISNTIKKVE